MRTVPRQLIASLVVPLALLGLSCDVAAQTGAPQLWMDARLPASARITSLALALDRLPLSVGAWSGSVALPQRGRPRDSLKNGTVIGAVVGAAALGGLAAVVCKAYQEPRGPSCLKDTLRLGAVGAAIGAGAGLVVDAALSRRPGVRVSVGIRF